MRVTELEKYGLPNRLITFWRERQGETLLPVQRKAIQRGLLGSPYENGEAPKSLLITAPTSAGKSFCAEMAMARCLASRQKTICVFPLKSLAEEKHRQLQESFGALGVRCLIATGDHPENDQALLDGEFDVAVAIIEKLDQLLCARMELMRNVALVVVDELQLIGEPSRGAVLERLLTKILCSDFSPALLGLSAVISTSSGRQLAEWLGAELVEEQFRPVELLRGVAALGSFKYRAYNSGEDGAVPFVDIRSGDEALLAFMEQLREETGSTLVFLKSRRETVDFAFRLAASVHWPPATRALKRLEDEEPSFLVRGLRQALQHGLAFHNSDLSPLQRQIVETAFREKEIRVLFSTTTLALGVNLPADTVYLETVKYAGGDHHSAPTLVPISRAEFDNMTGRAGRLGFELPKPARAIVLAGTEFEQDVLWGQYIADSHDTPLPSCLASVSLADWALHLLICGLANSRRSLIDALRYTYWHRCGLAEPAQLEAEIDWLMANGLVEVDSSGEGLIASAAGGTATRSGLTCRETMQFLSILQSAPPCTELGWLALALSSPDLIFPPAMLSRHELMANAAVHMLYQRCDHTLEEVMQMLPENHRRQPLNYRAAAAIKGLLLLEDWRKLASVQQLEEQYQLHLGQIGALGDSVAHLLRGLAALLTVVNSANPALELLPQLAFGVKYGLPEECRTLFEQAGKILRRAELRALWQAEIFSIEAFQARTEAEQERLIPHRHKREALRVLVPSDTQEVSMKTPYGSPVHIAGHRPESIEIDGTYLNDRYLVRVNGLPVRLTGKSFKYLTKLAWSRICRESGWIYKEDIEVGFNQARYLYRMKNEMFTGLQSDWQVFENNRLGYYRLDIDPGSIRINFQNLKDFPDFEIQQLAGSPTPAPAPQISPSPAC